MTSLRQIEANRRNYCTNQPSACASHTRRALPFNIPIGTRRGSAGYFVYMGLAGAVGVVGDAPAGGAGESAKVSRDGGAGAHLRG